MIDTIYAADLFCGGGGSSEGLAQACDEMGRKVNLVAVNHNPVAVASHQANHPEAKHYVQDVRNVKPREAVPSGNLNLLLAGAPCPHFSVARGGRPMDEHERSTPKEIVKWVQRLDNVDDVIVENVQEFRTWGPLYKRGPRRGYPIPDRMGETYKEFIKKFERMKYNVDVRILNAADYGAATTRKRLFIQARKNMDPIWPDPSHTPETYRTANEIIDWSIEGKSIFERDKPLANKTIDRIAAGIERFCGEWAQPFLCMLYGTGTARSIMRPLPTVTSGGGRGGGHIGLCQFILQQQSGGAPRSVLKPGPTISTSGAQSLVDACLIPFYGERKGQTPRTHSLKCPLPVIPASGNGKFAKIDFIVKYYGTGIAHSVMEPAPTVTTKDRIGVVECDKKGYYLDIRFRMLQPHELAAAMSFPKDYKFLGSRADQIRQIGNAWDVNLGKALCLSVLKSRFAA